MILKTIIIDDEAGGRQNLRQQCALLHLNVDLIGEAADAQSGLEMAIQLVPDLIFLDIEMPDRNGFWLLERLPKQKTAVVFVTAYDQYALKAFRYAALDYILKPILPEQLKEVVARCETYLQNGLSTAQLIHRLQLTQGQNKIAIPLYDGYDYVHPSDILWIQGEDNYSRIFRKDGKNYLVAKTLGKYEEMLEHEHFLRIHKSYLVNMDNIKAWSQSPSLQVCMDGHTWLEISRRKSSRFMDMLSFHNRSLKRIITP